MKNPHLNSCASTHLRKDPDTKDVHSKERAVEASGVVNALRDIGVTFKDRMGGRNQELCVML